MVPGVLYCKREARIITEGVDYENVIVFDVDDGDDDVFLIFVGLVRKQSVVMHP